MWNLRVDETHYIPWRDIPISTTENSTLPANCVLNFHDNLFSHFTSTPAEILAFRSSQDKDSICLLDMFLLTHDLHKQMTLLVE
jgi:hypothetical protein